MFEEHGSIKNTKRSTIISSLCSYRCSGTCLKFIYLACSTLISASFIIECIFLHLIITPYLSESIFEPGLCYLHFSQLGRRLKCETKCSKEHSTFPCLRIQVLYLPLLDSAKGVEKAIRSLKRKQPEGINYINLTEARFLYLYNHYSTYASYKHDQCSTSPCNRREANNNEVVEHYLRELKSSVLIPCYARPLLRTVSSELEKSLSKLKMKLSQAGTRQKAVFLPAETARWVLAGSNQTPIAHSEKVMAAALIHRLYPTSILFHSLVWPSGVLLSSLLLLLFLYLKDGCRVWSNDMTIIA